MKMFFILSVLINASILLASDTNKSGDITEQAIQKAIEKEKKYAREQKFYTEENYDFKGAEVNEESLKNVPEIEVEDLDMTNVYD